MRQHCHSMWRVLRTRVRLLFRAPDAGYVSEFVLATALLISLVLVVVGVIAAKLIAKANGFEL